jgi:hypothetical protein
MWVNDTPHKGLELEGNVGNVKNGQQPIISVAREIEVGGHAGDTSVANVGAVEEREEVCKRG